MNSNETNYKWEYSEFTTASELQKFVDEIKSVLIGEKIKSLFITSNDYSGTYVEGYNLLNDNENVSIDVPLNPVILKIGAHTLMFEMYAGSNLGISLDKEFKIIDSDAITYVEISSLYSKNVIGQQVADIKIEKITKYDAMASINLYPNRVLSDDMFESIIFELDNNHKFVITVLHSNTGIVEGSIE